MENIHFDIKTKTFWISYSFIQNYGVKEDTISKWSIRKICGCIYMDGRAYINYDTIPAPTRKKLPTKEELKKEYHRLQQKPQEEYFRRELQAARENGYDRFYYWQNQLVDHELYGKTIDRFKICDLAREASVFERAIDLNHAWRSLTPLYNAINDVLPNRKYADITGFKKALTKAKKDGIFSIIVDKRMFRKTKPKYGRQHEAIAFFMLDHPRNFTVKMAYAKFKEGCMLFKMSVPAFDWFRTYYRKNKNEFSDSREAKAKSTPIYPGITPAEHAGTQWQIDGWEIPINAKKLNDKGGWDKYVKYILFTVMDAHSRKIVGYRIEETENTETILKGLDNAVKKTGYLPREIVADNHTWNKTKIAENIKEKFKDMGVTWVVDSNPRRKAIIERSFRTLGDNHFKQEYGYIGQGVKTKIKTGKTNQVLLDRYNKTENMLVYDQIVAITVKVVKEYNNSIIKKLGDTPNNLHEKSEKPNAIIVDDPTRMYLFFRESEATIRNGQITLQRGAFEKHEYQLPADLHSEWNNRKIAYRMADFDHIYLYDIKTGKFIHSISEKKNIHGALADQTEADKEALFRSSGRIKGIKANSRKKKEKGSEDLDTISPDAYTQLNELTTPKETIAKVRRDHELRKEMIEEYNVNPDTTLDLPVVNEMLDTSMKPKEKRDINSPFQIYEKVEKLEKLEKLKFDI